MKKAFTLIELLIVVAIIAVLAAIAVPNFLEAQTRSKVSRIKADMRTIGLACESYMVDHNRPLPIYLYVGYPAMFFDNPQDTSKQTGWVWWLYVEFEQAGSPVSDSPKTNGTGLLLTTPVSYLTAIPIDPFMTVHPKNQFWPARRVASCWYRTNKPLHVNTGNRLIRDVGYTLESCGPDQRMWQEAPQDAKLYDPTNGTVSRGDIIYLGRGGGFPN